MEVPIPCECGGKVIVDEMQASVRVTCRCGREVDVPSLGALRRMSGLEASVSPRLTIEAMVANDQLPASNECSGCGAETDRIVDIWLIEKTTQRGGVGIVTRLLFLIVFALFGWITLLLLLLPKSRRTIDEGKEVRMPLRICDDCQRRWLSPLGTVPVIMLGILMIAAGVGASYWLHQPMMLLASVLLTSVLTSGALLWLKSQKHKPIRQLLSTESIYQKLLAQFPNSDFRVTNRETVGK